MTTWSLSYICSRAHNKWNAWNVWLLTEPAQWLLIPPQLNDNCFHSLKFRTFFRPRIELNTYVYSSKLESINLSSPCCLTANEIVTRKQHALIHHTSNSVQYSRGRNCWPMTSGDFLLRTSNVWSSYMVLIMADSIYEPSAICSGLVFWSILGHLYERKKRILLKVYLLFLK